MNSTPLTCKPGRVIRLSSFKGLTDSVNEAIGSGAFAENKKIISCPRSDHVYLNGFK